MNLNSIKTRFVGSYAFLILLFVIQLPILYLLVGGMSKKYAQVETAGDLKKRAIEINYILNRHIMNGEEEQEAVFQAQKGEFGKIVESLRTGTDDLPAITDSAALASLDTVEKEWNAMRLSLDEAMEAGDALSITMIDLEKSTYPMVDKLNEVVHGMASLKDPSYSKNIDLSGLLRMRTVNLSYLMERYARTNYELDEISAIINKTMKEFDDTLIGLRHGSAALGLRAVNGGIAARFEGIESLWTKRKELVDAGMKNKVAFAGKVNSLIHEHTPKVVAACEELTREIAVNAKSGAMQGIVIMAVTVIISIAMAVFFMWSTNKHMLTPLVRIKETVEDFTSGDLTKRSNVKVSFLGREIKDEIVSLGESVDAMASQVSNVIGRIAESSAQLASASEQLSASSTQIAEGADRQSGQTAQVATAMEEMNATVIEVAKNSQQVSESARSAQHIALDGGKVVEQAISAMQEVSESTEVTADTIKKLGRSSEEIGTIVSVINDIADQTNLLALNAAIEAARAGEQGRGFAVVADEVRKLAERTTKATKEISGMINTIQSETGKAVDAMAEGTQKVENGVTLANQAGEALKQIVTGVENVTDMISHIATSAEEQSSTTDEISRNMDSIAEVAKSNVSAIGEVANATNEMARLASELKDLVANFKITGSIEAEVRTIEPRKKAHAKLTLLKASGSN
ncbi:Methyl-accepting chemotaxis protein McpQ [uncultured bacterium]|nr:Methyl-accepting chemotaxis protein McpQ [uncultured bacterium]